MLSVLHSIWKIAAGGDGYENTLSTSAAEESAQLVTTLTSDFEELTCDLRRLLTVWSSRCNATLVMKQQELASTERGLADERARLYLEFDDYKAREMRKLHEAQQRLDNTLADVTKQIESEKEAARQRIEGEREKFELERQRFMRSIRQVEGDLAEAMKRIEEENRRVRNIKLSQSRMVEFNVGGQLFQTSRSTVESQRGSLLCDLISGRHEGISMPIFIDRDPA
ncbi:putative kelch domain protein, partial [Gregarina niphandrodes]